MFPLTRPPPSTVSSMEQAKRYLRSLPPCPSHAFEQYSLEIIFSDLFNYKAQPHTRFVLGSQLEPASPRKGADAFSQCFSHLLPAIHPFDDFGISRPIPKAKDCLRNLVPSFLFPLMDERRLPHDPYHFMELPSHEERIHCEFQKSLATFFPADRDLPSTRVMPRLNLGRPSSSATYGNSSSVGNENLVVMLRLIIP